MESTGKAFTLRNVDNVDDVDNEGLTARLEGLTPDMNFHWGRTAGCFWIDGRYLVADFGECILSHVEFTVGH